MNAFTLLDLETDQPLRQFLYSCACALTDRLEIIDRRFVYRDEGIPMSGRLQWARAGLSGLHAMTPNGWRPPRGKPPVTAALWRLAERIATRASLEELLDVETAIRREAMRVLMDTRAKPVSLWLCSR